MSSSGRLTNDPWRGPRRRRTILALAGLALLGSCEDCGAGGEDSFPDTWDSGDGTADEECTPCPCWAVACMDLSDDLEVFGLYDLDGGHDASGDGELDVVVGAYAADGSSEHGGTAYLFSGPLEGHYESSEMDASFTLDRLQRLVHVEMLGDMDGDGVAEVAFLNAYSGDGAYQAEVAVLLGPWTSAETVATADAVISGFTMEYSATSRHPLVAAGDQNGDGLADLAQGAFWGDEDLGPELVVFHGPVSDSLTLDDADAAYYIPNVSGNEYERYVRLMVGEHDLTGDGLPDLLVSVPESGEDDIYLLPGGQTGALDLETSAAASIRGDGWELCFSDQSLAVGGDTNGDGHPDLAYVSRNAVSPGGEYIALFHGPLEGALFRDDAAARFELAGVDEYNASLYLPGDLDGDGYGELLVGEPDYFQVHSYYNPEIPGRLFVLYGPLTGTFDSWEVVGEEAAWHGESSGLGYSFASAGDVDDDGLSDVLISAPYRLGNGGAYLMPGALVER